MVKTSGSKKAQCERCGRCIQVCPSYLEKRIETFSPRGRLDLIRAMNENELSCGPRFAASMESCLQCLSCSAACPKGVDAAQIIRSAKVHTRRTVSGLRVSLERLVLSMIPSSRHALYWVTGLISRIQHLLPVKAISQGRHLPLFLPQILAGRRIPVLSRRSAFSEFPEYISPPSGVKKRGSVILHTGCFFGYVDTEPVRAALIVLRENGYTVRIPGKQTCCGAPSMLGGYPDIGKKIAQKSIEMLDGTDPVITLCATCCNFLKNEYPVIFFDDPKYHDRVIKLSERVKDINAFLAGLPDLKPGRKAVRKTVTIHDPCHLKKGLGISGEIRFILGTIPGLQISEMENSDRCCGGGGLCALKNPGLSGALGSEKADSIMNTPADIAATPCPGCMLQISDWLSRKKSRAKAMHPVELMAMSFGYKKNKEVC